MLAPRSVAIAMLAVALLSCGRRAPADASAAALGALVDPNLELIVTPSPNHEPFVHAIDAATKSIDMEMFHLTDPDVVEALVRAAGRGVHVELILDGEGLSEHKYSKPFARLRDGGVDARGSSPRFSITHEKAMVIDRSIAFITAINLTRAAATTRDFGIVTRAAGVVAEVERIFAADWANAANKTGDTPTLIEPSLLWSPVSSREKLTLLIAAAARTLDVTVENLGDSAITEALIAAAHRGVAARLIVPMCDKNPNPLYDFPAARELAAAGISVRMMPAPESRRQPYMHSKMILADGAIAYVGSVNFSVSSTTKARELGILFANPAAAKTIAAAFEEDWGTAVAIPASNPTCSKED